MMMMDELDVFSLSVLVRCVHMRGYGSVAGMSPRMKDSTSASFVPRLMRKYRAIGNIACCSD